MKMIWKKMLCLVLCLCMVLAIGGCGEEAEEQTEEELTGETHQTTEQPLMGGEPEEDKDPVREEDTPTEDDESTEGGESTESGGEPDMDKDPEGVPTDDISVEDIQNVQLVQDNDQCPVKIISTKVVENHAPGQNNPDLLQFTVENKSGHEVTALKYNVVGYDERKSEWVMVYVSNYIPLQQQSGIANVPVTELNIAHGGTQQLTLACRKALFTVTRAIITQYTLADGTVFDNPSAKEWEEAVKQRTGISTELEGVDSDTWRAMEELEAQTEPVKISGKKLVRNYSDGSDGAVGIHDAIVLTVENSGSEAVTGMSVYVIGYDAQEGTWKRVRTLTVGAGSASKVVQIDVTEPIAAGASVEVPVFCDSTLFTHATAITASCTLADGTSCEIEQAQQWLSLIEG